MLTITKIVPAIPASQSEFPRTAAVVCVERAHLIQILNADDRLMDVDTPHQQRVGFLRAAITALLK